MTKKDLREKWRITVVVNCQFFHNPEISKSNNNKYKVRNKKQKQPNKKLITITTTTTSTTTNKNTLLYEVDHCEISEELV